MKHLKIATMITAASMILCGCSKPISGRPASHDGEIQQTNQTQIFTDTNKCQYIIWNSMEAGGITPRMGPDGKQVCT